MVSGTYLIALQTPMGLERGLLTLQESGGVLSGSIQTRGRISRFTGGRCSGDGDGAQFSFQGILSLGLVKIPYTARGTVRGDALDAVADTRSGSFPLRGQRPGQTVW